MSMKRARAKNVHVLTGAEAVGARLPVIAGKSENLTAADAQFHLSVGPLVARPMALEKSIEIEGTITSVLPGTMFRVDLDNARQVLAHISGKMRKRFIRLTVGDRVKMEMSPYDMEKARIVYRL